MGIIYKGLLLAPQLEGFYPDLGDPDMCSALALVHQRYSTNTFPTWDLAQPFRYLAHNGEINTVRGNCNWMTAREALFESGMIRHINHVFGNFICHSLLPFNEIDIFPIVKK